MKRVSSLLLILLLIAAACLPAAAAGYSAQVSAASAILYNTESAEVLYAKNASGPILPGGSALMMTALAVSETLGDPDKLITVETGGSSGDRLSPPLAQGEQMTVRDLLAAILLSGSSDAASAAALAVSYDMAGFVSVMNGKAAVLGMTATVYSTPDGSPSDENVNLDPQTTTVNDVLKLAIAVRSDPILSEILSCPSLETSGPTVRTLSNTNPLVDGASAGEADPASVRIISDGFCAPILREDGCMFTAGNIYGTPLLCVLLGGADADALIRDTEGLLDYGGGRMENVSITELLSPVPLSYTSAAGAVYSVTPSFPEGELSISDTFNRSGISVAIEKREDNTGVAVYRDADGNTLAEVPVTFSRILSEGELKGRRVLLWGIGILTLFLCVVLIFGLRRFYYTYMVQKQKRRGFRLDGAAPLPESTQAVRNSFNYHFPVWALWGLALLLVIVIALCFNMYPR
ncbi:MAG: D-alanyl-D-alanine carboxypeptidase [Oscillospiraceae bacterium]|nr:D-alanyl-D-alanine carboxypeptidase [Oscillospiraceae bacterium]